MHPCCQTLHLIKCVNVNVNRNMKRTSYKYLYSQVYLVLCISLVPVCWGNVSQAWLGVGEVPSWEEVWDLLWLEKWFQEVFCLSLKRGRKTLEAQGSNGIIDSCSTFNLGIYFLFSKLVHGWPVNACIVWTRILTTWFTIGHVEVFIRTNRACC